MQKRKISAEIIADSKNEFGQRITSFVVTFPRIILAEFNTHRVFSRNSASSRAIPFKKMLRMVLDDPFIPIAWQKDHKGMQGTEYLDPNEKHNLMDFIEQLEKLFDREEDQDLKEIYIEVLKSYADTSYSLIEWWLLARDKVLEAAVILSLFGTTKQLCNRLLEPFMWHTVIVTSTEWSNFFALRCPKYVVGDLKTDGKGGIEVKNYRSRKVVLKEYSHFAEQVSEMWWLKMNIGQAEIHAMSLSEVMWDAMNENTPKELKAGEWHIPFGENIDESKIFHIINNPNGSTITWKPIPGADEGAEEYYNQYKIKIATARDARISYLNFEGKDDYVADAKLHDDLLESGHMSPFEHCARAMNREEYYSHLNGVVTCTDNQLAADNQIQQISLIKEETFGWSGNFRGFVQYRKMIAGENIK